MNKFGATSVRQALQRIQVARSRSLLDEVIALQTKKKLTKLLRDNLK